MRVVRENHLEGVVAKRRDSIYRPGKRSGEWVKVRANRREEFIIGGYVPTERNAIGRLLQAYVRA
jgi:bifunctional non-homologous end joining protein LigD